MEPQGLNDEEKKKIIQEKLKDSHLVFISSQYPMTAAGYKDFQQIGIGMMSNKVFSAVIADGDPSIRGHKVAIKQIDLSQQSDEFRTKIMKEVQGMSLVTRSEHVVQFHCSFVHEQTLCIVMDLQEGSVHDVLKCKYKNGFDDEAVIASIVYQTLQGIDFLHEKAHIIHRDLKAGNLLFNKEGKIKLADFGVSAILSNIDEKRTTMAGTWHWMAPEVIDPSDHGGYDKKADLWSLGISCIELAYGVAPYSDQKPNQVIVYIMNNPPPTLENPRVPNFNPKKFSSAFKDFVKCCLQNDPKKRPPASKLLTHKFFSQVASKPPDLKHAFMDGLPSILERFKQQLEQRKKIAGANLAALDANKKIQPSQNNETSLSRKNSAGKDKSDKIIIKEKEDKKDNTSEEQYSESDELLP